jgi:hypothetical protein
MSCGPSKSEPVVQDQLLLSASGRRVNSPPISAEIEWSSTTILTPNSSASNGLTLGRWLIM